MPQLPARPILGAHEAACPVPLDPFAEFRTDPEAQKLRDRSGRISHELRTCLAILTFLSGNLDLLYERLDDDKRRKMIRDIRKHAQKLNSFIEDVLQVGDEGMSIPM